MRARVRENAPVAAAAGLCSVVMGWLGLYGYAWTNYESEAQPAFEALAHGHLLEFLRLAPSYGGSLVERAPFALLPGLWGGGKLAVYRAVAVPCLAALAALAVWLVAQTRARGARAPERPRGLAGDGPWARSLVLALCVANPLTLLALEHGHPEEMLGAALCVAAVLLAARNHPVWAGLALGLAVANKEWAIVAAGPVLLALPAGGAVAVAPQRALAALGSLVARARGALLCCLSAGIAAGAVLAPLMLVPGGGFSAAANGVASTPSTIFLPWSVWWFAGHHGAVVRDPFGTVVPGYRTAPGWVGPLSHPSVVLAAALLSALLLWVRHRAATRASGAPAFSRRQGEALLLLALVLLARCLLDTWDYIYYPLPFLIALVSWEALGDHRPRLAVLSLVATALAWASFMWITEVTSPDVQSAFFMAWTLPLTAALALRLYAPARATALLGALGAGRGTAPQETSVSALGSELRLRLPSAPSTTRSSMRTPSSPGT